MAVLSEAAPTSSRMTLLKLGKMCSRRRGIACSTAHIWSSVYLRLSRRWYQAQAALRAWLNRSGRYSLAIHLTLEDESVWTHATPQKVIATLALEPKKWYSVNFVLSEACRLRLEIVEGNPPVLILFVLQSLSSDCRWSQANRKRLTAFENAPELRTMGIITTTPLFRRVKYYSSSPSMSRRMPLHPSTCTPDHIRMIFYHPT